MKTITYKDKNKEKTVYAFSLNILSIFLIILFILAIASSPLDVSITGAIVQDQRNLTPIIEKQAAYFDYENIENFDLENISQEMALNFLLLAEFDIQEMQDASFSVSWVKDALLEAKRYFEGEDYTALLQQIRSTNDIDKRNKAITMLKAAQEKIGTPVDYKQVYTITKTIRNRKIEAFEIRDLIRVAELRMEEIEQINLPTSSIQEIISRAKTEFNEERFSNAHTILNKIEPAIDEIESENTFVKTIYRAGKETTTNFIKDHIITILLTSILIIVILLLSYNRIIIKILNNKVYDMNIEKQVLKNLIKKAQTDYFTNKTIPQHTYKIKINKYRESMQQIKEQLPVIKRKRRIVD